MCATRVPWTPRDGLYAGEKDTKAKDNKTQENKTQENKTQENKTQENNIQVAIEGDG
jgi:hypothetical protein